MKDNYTFKMTETEREKSIEMLTALRERLEEKKKKPRRSRRPSMSKKCDFLQTLIPMT